MDFAAGDLRKAAPEGRTAQLIMIHGAVMLAVWVVVLPAGVLFARYANTPVASAYELHNNDKCCACMCYCCGSRPLWKAIHMTLQYSGTAAAAGVAVLAWLQFEGVTTSMVEPLARDAHRGIAITLFVLLVAQILVGHLRGDSQAGQASQRRSLLGSVHWLVGRLTLLLGVINVCIGVSLNVGGLQASALAWVGGLMLALVVMAALTLLLELRARRKQARQQQQQQQGKQEPALEQQLPLRPDTHYPSGPVLPGQGPGPGPGHTARPVAPPQQQYHDSRLGAQQIAGALPFDGDRVRQQQVPAPLGGRAGGAAPVAMPTAPPLPGQGPQGLPGQEQGFAGQGQPGQGHGATLFWVFEGRATGPPQQPQQQQAAGTAATAPPAPLQQGGKQQHHRSPSSEQAALQASQANQGSQQQGPAEPEGHYGIPVPHDYSESGRWYVRPQSGVQAATSRTQLLPTPEGEGPVGGNSDAGAFKK